jgi:hypothetical protein
LGQEAKVRAAEDTAGMSRQTARRRRRRRRRRIIEEGQVRTNLNLLSVHEAAITLDST